MTIVFLQHHPRVLISPPNLQSWSSPPVGLGWTEPRGKVFDRCPHGLDSFPHLEGAEGGRWGKLCCCRTLRLHKKDPLKTAPHLPPWYLHQ